MRIIIQRVKNASIVINGKDGGQIGRGFVVLFGACESDTTEVTDRMLKKLIGLRIFDDAEGKTNLSLEDVGGELMFVSQFTLYADCKKGYRPSFIGAGSPAHAEQIYNYALEQLRTVYGICPVTGEFGAHMEVSLTNDGPFTINLDSEVLGYN